MVVQDGQSLLHCAAVNDHVGAVMFIADCLQQFNINLKDKVYTFSTFTADIF